MNTTDQTNTTSGAAVAAPVDRHVRPCAWRVPVLKLRGKEWRYTTRKTREDAEPVYSQADLDAAIALERARWEQRVDPLIGYGGSDARRDWVSAGAWLYPGDTLAVVRA